MMMVHSKATATSLKLFARLRCMMRVAVLPCILLLSIAVVNADHVQASNPSASMVFQDIRGESHGWPSKEGRNTVIVFISEVCPIANAYHPTLSALRKEFSDKELDFVLVHSNTDLTQAEAEEHARQYSVSWSVALDAEQRVARSLKARVTPEAFVISSKGQVLYRGRIDDQYVALGKKRPKPTTHDLRVALEQIQAGQEVLVSETKPVGCVIRYPKP